MASVTELRDNGSEVTNVATPIVEPLAAQEIFGNKLGRFGDHYNTSPNSHLYRYLVALCGEAGAGSLKKELLLPRLYQSLQSTQYLNLDRLYGDTLALPRLSSEVYSLDPENQTLTATQWDEVRAKDAEYRERCLTWMRAILEGPTPRGLELAGEAATGVECDVVEQYAYLDALQANQPQITNLTTADTGAGGAVTITFAHVTSNVNNRCLFVAVSAAGSHSVSSITYNGVGLTLVKAENPVGRMVELWRLINPPNGSFNVVVTYNSSAVGVATALTFSNVHQTTPTGTARSTSVVGNDLSLKDQFTIIPSNIGEFVIDAFYISNLVTHSSYNQFVISDHLVGASHFLSIGGRAAAYPATAVQWPLVNAGITTSWSGLGVAIKPATLPVMTGVGVTSSRREFVIIPREPTITESERRRIVRLVDQLKPTDTIATINLGNDLRNARQVRNVASSSNKFLVKKLVTGRTDIVWPPIDPNAGYWIQSGVAVEAPTFAFMDRQESVTHITINTVTASSEHMGRHSLHQRSLFANLAKLRDADHYFQAGHARAKSIAPLNIQQGWVNTSRGEAHDTIVANIHYPIGYFALEGINAKQEDVPDQFWSSVEKDAGQNDSLILDFGTSRPANFLTFELTPKPFDFVIEYDDGSGNWLPVIGKDTNRYSLSMLYMPSMENPWAYFDHHFEKVVTQRIRITFTRRGEAWPLPSSVAFPFSVDIRGLRCMNVIADVNDHTPDVGTDILGNSFATAVIEHTPDAVLPINLVKNPRAEQNTNQWTAYYLSGTGLALNRVTGDAPTDVFNATNSATAFEITGAPTSSALLFYSDASQAVPVFAGETLNLSAYVKRVTANVTTISVNARLFDVNGVYFNEVAIPSASATTGLDAWQRLSGSYVVPANTGFVAVEVLVNTNTSTTTARISGVQITKGATLYNYIDPTPLTYWQSQPNPTKNAVEALYFDLRLSAQPGTMDLLDTLSMDDLEGRTQSDVELYYVNGQIVDEIFVDPVYPGSNMQFYYSFDDEGDWDEKLWIPIPRNYICKKGYHSLPSPQVVRYFKIEFSNLPALPYQPVEYPTMPQVTYREFPTWVVEFFNSTVPVELPPTSLEQIEKIIYEPLDLFKKIDDRMGVSFEQMRQDIEKDHTPEIKSQIEQLLGMQIDQTPQTAIESNINYNSVVMWQRDLMMQLDPTHAAARKVTEPRVGQTDTGFNAELGLPAYIPPLQQSVNDLTETAIDKLLPAMWFPRLCRHGYKIVQGSLDSKIAYSVAIRQVAFHRRNYLLANDEPVYIETLDDSVHILNNDFAIGDSAYFIGL